MTAGEAAAQIGIRIVRIIGIHIEPTIIGIPVGVDDTNTAAPL